MKGCRIRVGIGCIAVAASLLITWPAGATTIFTNRGLFDAAVGPTMTEGFETTPLGPLTLPYALPSGIVVDLAAGSIGAAVEDGDPPTGFGFTNTTPGGQNVLGFVGGTGTTYTGSFSLPGAATGFGFDLSGFQPVGFGSGGFTASFYLGVSLVDSTFVPASSDFTVDFWGFETASSFDSAQMTFGGSGLDYVAFDEVSFNSASVPEPSTLVLLGAGLLSLAGYLRRRKH